MRNLLILSMTWLLCLAEAHAQNDKLYLVNNGYLRGKLVSANADHVLMALHSDDTLQVKIASLVGLRLQQKKTREAAFVALARELNRKTNYQLFYELAVGGHFDDSDFAEKVCTSLSGSAMYRLAPLLQFGVGIDYNRYARFEVVPVYIKYMGQLSQTPNKGWFYYGALGLAKTWKRGDCDCMVSSTKGGRITKLGLGYRFAVDEFSLSLGLGWLQQRLTYDYQYPSEYLYYYPTTGMTVRQRLNGLEMKLGVVF